MPSILEKLTCTPLRAPSVLLQDYYNMIVATSGGGTLALENKPEVDIPSTALALLARTTPASPGLTSLTISRVTTPATAALLCQALLHHTSLSHLDLSWLSWRPTDGAPSAGTVYSTLPQLSGLTSLVITASLWHKQDLTAISATTRALVAALSALPALASVHLHASPSDACEGFRRKALQSRSSGLASFGGTADLTCKRRRVAQCIGRPEAPSLDPIIAALSTAPALTALRLSCILAAPADQWPCSGILGPFTSLRHLHVGLRGAHTAPEALVPAHRLYAISPLPALHTLTFASSRDCTNCLPLTEMLASAAQQPSLAHIQLLPGHPPSDEMGHAGPRCATQQSPLSLTLHVSVLEEKAGVENVVSRLAQLERLHSLRLVLDMTGPTGSPPALSETALRPLSCLQQLRDLRVVVAPATSTDSTGAVLRTLWGAPLRALGAALTALTLDFGHTRCMHAHVLREHLPWLTGLESLCLKGVHCQAADELSACMAPLTRLTELDVAAAPVDSALVRCFAECAGLMPQLQRACLRSCAGDPPRPMLGTRCVPPPGSGSPLRHAAADWVEGLPHLPGRGSFEFGVVSAEVTLEECTAVRQELLGRGACVSEDCRQIGFQ
eukprot:jgi/Ulvmu1/1979/UM012_0141.1